MEWDWDFVWLLLKSFLVGFYFMVGGLLVALLAAWVLAKRALAAEQRDQQDPQVISTPIGRLYVFNDGTTFYRDNAGRTLLMLHGAVSDDDPLP